MILMFKEDVSSRNALMVCMFMVTAMATFATRWAMNPLARSKKWAHFVRDTLTEVAIVLQLWILHSVMGDWQPITGAMLNMATIALPASVLYMLIVHYIKISEDGRANM